MTTFAAAAVTALATTALLGCTPPFGDVLVICHNANCAANASIEGDDTLPALDRSLALRTAQGRVVFDGIELDSVWHRRTGRCVFSHAPDPRARDLAEAIQRVAAHVASSPPDTAGHGDVFYLKLELKTDVGGGASHTTDEIAAHVACVTAAAGTVIAAGADSHNTVVPIFDSDDPALLAAIDPRPFDGAAGCLFETNWGAALPAGFAPQILTLGWYEASDATAWPPDTNATPRSTSHRRDDSGIAIWARSPPAEELYTILAQRPRYLVVNNAEEARGLLE